MRVNKRVNKRANKQPGKRPKAAKGMSLSEFLTRLKAIRGIEWRLDGSGIRGSRDSNWCDYMCPITAVAAELGFGYAIHNVVYAAEDIGISRWSRWYEIVSAADDRYPQNDRLRKRLLAAVGLKECPPK